MFHTTTSDHSRVLITWLAFFLLAATFVGCKKEETPNLLVFSKTAGFRHESIEAGQEALRKMAAEQGWNVTFSENDSLFYEESLKKFHAVVFLNTTGDVLNPEQQNNFERFIQAGGGYLGIHSATDTEYDWPWYGKLAGAYFRSHPNNPNVKEGEYYVVDHNHEACDSLPDRFTRTDEFYNFNDISPDIKVLVKIDEKSYTGGENGDNHPMSWYQEFDGGRAFYTGMGHTNEAFSEPLFLNHLLGGLRYVIGGKMAKPLDYAKAHTKRMPEENRFAKVVLEENLNEPMELAILPDGNVLFIERHGAIKMYDKSLQETRVIDSIRVSTTYNPDENGRRAEAEDGLLGVTLDPNFKTNHWIYFYYSAEGDDSNNVLARVEFKNNAFDWDTKKVMLKVAVQRDECCHTGGSMAWDKAGNLYLSTGDNTSPRANVYGPIDEREGRMPWDAQKSSGNTNDLRGSILRIHPEADGSYTIPEGNLFPVGTEKTRPEIYVKGTRNPYRISLDQKTGFLYWGEVGPDAREDSATLGSRGYDEVNQARKAGYFGWPYFVGNNYAYGDLDFATNTVTVMFDPAGATNNSPNNTGLSTLPSVSPAFIWYPYAESEEFPLVGTGARNAMAGPVFYREDFKGAARPFPDYYDGKLLIYDWMRGWIMAVTMDAEGNYESMERLMPSYKFSNPMDMAFSEDGDLYVLEYGSGWFSANADARLVRIEYTAGNRSPQVEMRADKLAGAVPLAVNFSAKGTQDPDGNPLSYSWKISKAGAAQVNSFSTSEGAFTFTDPGQYEVVLTVTDGKGGSTTSALNVQAGNEPPKISLNITNGNSGFFFLNQPFAYEVVVNDKEDGSTGDGQIAEDAVSITIDYLAEGYDKTFVAAGHKFADELSASSTGLALMKGSDCMSCHAINKASVGPTYMDVAQKYKNDPQAASYLANKIKNGGSGVWGQIAMAAHPDLKDEDAASMVAYILSLAKQPANTYPLAGTFTPTIKPGESDQGVFIIRAAYTDRGANGIEGLKTEEVLILRNANLSGFAADEVQDVMKLNLPNPPMKLAIAQKDGAWLKYNDVDLSGMGSVMFVTSVNSRFGMVGGIIEVHIDAPDGPKIGETGMIRETPPVPGNPMGSPSIGSATLSGATGKHDLYFVCRNPNDPEASLFVLMNAIFQGAPAQ
ncbi:MAG: ThuA domain-containing protein [Bacteroidia bacterium]|nr:ThuA domain-containing protein [Bacteroidia bacterium]